MEILLDPSPGKSKSDVVIPPLGGLGGSKRTSDVEKGSLGKLNQNVIIEALKQKSIARI